jgi:hypothetical protein
MCSNVDNLRKGSNMYGGTTAVLAMAGIIKAAAPPACF